jgi:preprotein translocase subunit SecE
LEEDIEGLKTKMKTKENNPFFMQVNQFFAEVKDVYMPDYRNLMSPA